jgi:hypothetical protein
MTTPPASPRRAADDLAFPEGATLYVGAGLVLFSAVAIVGLLQLLSGTGLFSLALCPSSIENASAATCGESVKMAIAVFAGAIGAAVYAIERFIVHAVKEGSFGRSYTAWYVLRPLQGSLLAVIFYLLLRGGLLALGTPVSGTATDLNHYGLASLCALVGMFSNDAMQRLRLTFQTLFATGSGKSAADGGNPTPPPAEVTGLESPPGPTPRGSEGS